MEVNPTIINARRILFFRGMLLKKEDWAKAV
jgi:hypothetical protein